MSESKPRNLSKEEWEGYVDTAKDQVEARRIAAEAARIAESNGHPDPPEPPPEPVADVRQHPAARQRFAGPPQEEGAPPANQQQLADLGIGALMMLLIGAGIGVAVAAIIFSHISGGGEK